MRTYHDAAPGSRHSSTGRGLSSSRNTHRLSKCAACGNSLAAKPLVPTFYCGPCISRYPMLAWFGTPQSKRHA